MTAGTRVQVTDRSHPSYSRCGLVESPAPCVSAVHSRVLRVRLFGDSHDSLLHPQEVAAVAAEEDADFSSYYRDHGGES